MKKLLLLLAITIVHQFSAAQVTTDVPETVDKNKLYVFYLHGAIVQYQGENAVSPAYGKYMYRAIVDSLSNYGYHVISEVRPKNATVNTYAEKVATQVKTLISKGIPAKNIIVMGASMGGSIATKTAEILANKNVRFVVMGICSGSGDDNEKICGNFFSIYEASDGPGSCANTLKNKPCISGFKEIKLTMGNGHGFLYQPYKEWLHPLVHWINVTPE